MFQSGNPGGPGRPRKRAHRPRGTPWVAIRQEGADVAALAEQWTTMIRGRHYGALQQLLEMLMRNDPADAAIVAAMRQQLRRRSARVPV